MSLKRSYNRIIRRQFGLQAAWMPGQILHLGDYGTMDEGVFVYKGRLSDLGGPSIQAESEPRDDDTFSATTGAGTEVTIKVEGQVLEGTALPQGKAGVTFSLKDEHALVCKLSGARQDRIANIKAVSDFVRGAYKAGKWERDWRLVTERIVAKGATIVYSESGNSRIDATAEVPIKNYADASIGLGVIHNSGSEVHVVGAADLAPFVRIMKLHVFPNPSKPDLRGGNVLTGVHDFAGDELRERMFDSELVEDEGDTDLDNR